jgi:hypothetical protein
VNIYPYNDRIQAEWSARSTQFQLQIICDCSLERNNLLNCCAQCSLKPWELSRESKCDIRFSVMCAKSPSPLFENPILVGVQVSRGLAPANELFTVLSIEVLLIRQVSSFLTRYLQSNVTELPFSLCHFFLAAIGMYSVQYVSQRRFVRYSNAHARAEQFQQEGGNITVVQFAVSFSY